jgi:DNA (cytosine-5)-methyltransferase 1
MNNITQATLFKENKFAKNEAWFSKAIDILGISQKSGWPDDFGDALLEWNSDNISTPIKVLSLFSGAGGLDIGFHDAGFQIVECNEIENTFAETLLKNSKHGSRLDGSNIVCMDIKEYDPLLEDIDFVIGGPPCQTFSAAGARASGVNGTDDERGNLFKQYVRILKMLKPSGFLFENVYRIVGAQDGKPWMQIQKAFEDVGYKLHWRILDAADYGVPQFRERLIIVGLKEGSYKFPYPSHGPDSLDRQEYYNSGKAVAGVCPEIQSIGIGGRHGYLLNDIPPGLNYSFYTEKLGHPKPIFGWRSKFSDYLYKADPNTPVRTIKAQGGQYTGPFHWDNRTFTVEELKRLQTFPDTYSIVGNRQKIIHQLGNSVPPQLARILALSILQQVFDQKLPFDLQIMPDSYKLGFRARKRVLTNVYAKKASDAISRLSKGTPKEFYEGEGRIFGKLTENLQLLTTSEPDSADFILEHSVLNGSWTFNLFEKEKTDQAKYELSVFPISSLGNNSVIKLLSMRSFSTNPKSILGLWKYMEKIIKEYVYKDDLVQLFGYYQNQQNYSVNMEIFDSFLSNKLFWKVISRVSKGHHVGKLLQINELAYGYGSSVDNLITELKKLKKLGFEIRNHNTNKQIRKGMILIPYTFPSLNERSLQRLTEL